MQKLELKEIQKYVEKNIDIFHQKRLDRLENLKLSAVLQRKNPYLFKAKNILTSQDLVKKLLDAHLSSQEETIFGDFLEGLAIFINKKVCNGWKSSASGIDLEFDKDNIRYIVSIKSGPNWGNKDQLKKLRENFKTAKKVLRTGNAQFHIVAINGCCYGICVKCDKGDYFKYCGQKFWKFISDDEDLYLKIIKPLGYKAKEKNDKFHIKYAQILNSFTAVFIYNFCINGIIDWKSLVEYNSAHNKVKKRLAVPRSKK